MSSQGPFIHGSIAFSEYDDGANLDILDNVYASTYLDGDTLKGLVLDNYGFSIPSTDLILGVEVRVYRKASVSGTITDQGVYLIFDGSPDGQNKSVIPTWSTSDVTITYGSPTNKWGLLLTPDKVNDLDFGFYILVRAATGFPATAYIDHATVTVYHTGQTVELKSQTIELTLVAPLLNAPVNLNMTLQELAPLGPTGYFGISYDVTPTILAIDSIEFLGGIPAVDILLQMTQQILEPAFLGSDILFTIAHPHQVMEVSYLGSDILINPPNEVTMTCQVLEPRTYTTPLQFDLNIAHTQQLLTPQLHGAYSFVATPSLTKYLESSRSGVSIVMLGVEPGVFKLSPTATSFRRNGPQHTLHLTTVKPEIRTVLGVFRLLTPMADLTPGEFLYQSPGGYLIITNPDPIMASVLPGDVVSDAILVSPQRVSSTDLFGTIILDVHQPRTLLGF